MGSVRKILYSIILVAVLASAYLIINQFNVLQSQNQSLQKQNTDLKQQNTVLQQQNSQLSQEINQSKATGSNPDVRIIGFSPTIGESVVLSYTAWGFNVTIQNMKNESVTGLVLNVERIAGNVHTYNPIEHLINYTAPINTLSPNETKLITGGLSGDGFVGDFNLAGASYTVTLQMSQLTVIDKQTYTQF